MMIDKPKKQKKTSNRVERASKLMLDIPHEDESLDKSQVGVIQ